MTPENKPEKVTKLPRSGPSAGQSTNSYLAGLSKSDRRWSSLSPQAVYDGRKSHKLGRIKKGDIK